MKLTVKTLEGSHFEITVQSSDTVMAVKKNIEDLQGKSNYPCGQQPLIHNGNVLKDETTLAENKVSEDGFLVVMLGKSKTLGTVGVSSTQLSPTNPPTTALVSNSTPAAEVPVQPPVSKSTSFASDTTTSCAPTGTYGQAASNLVAEGNLEETIQQIMYIAGGNWDRETVARAL
ncbi:hypothetical protein I3760_02G025000 [Carya illinoinensis]|nr:hypothetical protein I3760_02G025000 [Carya illinoinensis]